MTYKCRKGHDIENEPMLLIPKHGWDFSVESNRSKTLPDNTT